MTATLSQIGLDRLTLARTWGLKFDSTATLDVYNQFHGLTDLGLGIEINQFTTSTAMEFKDTMNFNGLMEKFSNFGLEGNGIQYNATASRTQ